MKKNIITIVAVALAAVLLFTVYSIFLKDDGIEEVADPFYVLTDEAESALAELKEDVTVTLYGYDSSDDHWVIINRFAESVVNANKKFDLEIKDANGFEGVELDYDGKTERIEKETFFKTLYNGTPYAFNGEALMVNGILALAGKEEKTFELRALDGYDTDGHQVTSQGYPFMFPSFDRSKIDYLTIENSHGKYSVYQYDSSFYFDVSSAIAYDEEMFAQLTTNCRYVTTLGKMDLPEERTWAEYGLDLENASTAHYTILTTEDDEGNYFMHSVYIGNLASAGSYYYARYVGGMYNAKNEEEGESRLVHNFTNQFIYFLPISAVDASIALPQTDIMEPTIMTAITDMESLFALDDIRIDYYDKGISAVAKNMSEFNAADNLSAIDNTSLTKIISDKKNADSYSSYSTGWQNHIDVFGGFTSSDGKATYLEAAIARTAPNGNYTIKFGLLRDETNGAYLPSKITVKKSYDGINWHTVEGCSVSPAQSDGTIERYSVSFTDEKTVKYIRIGFDVPQKAQTYVVFDEIRIYADDKDAQPAAAVGGTWKLTSPSQYIASDRNFAYLDMTNFNNFVQQVAALEGERVVACGFSENGDATASLLDKELLGEYGLAEPAKHYSFTYDGVVCDVYVSAPDEETGKYYAYATYSGKVDGKNVTATTDVIVELSTETVEWLNWEFVEFLDHSLLSMYLVDIPEMEITFDGTEYAFDLSLDSEGALGKVTYNGKDYDVQSFKYLYQTILSIQMHDEYIPAENDNEPEEYLRIKVHSESSSPEFVFYRVSATRCYFTIDGEGSYYALVEDVDAVREDVLTYISGGTVTRR